MSTKLSSISYSFSAVHTLYCVEYNQYLLFEVNQCVNKIIWRTTTHQSVRQEYNKKGKDNNNSKKCSQDTLFNKCNVKNVIKINNHVTITNLITSHVKNRNQHWPEMFYRPLENVFNLLSTWCNLRYHRA